MRYDTGSYEPQIGGYRAFVPRPPPNGATLRFDASMLTLISQADRALARLDGSVESLPAPDLFLLQYIRKEAVLSSQIEGTQASLSDVLNAEAQVLDPSAPHDVIDVVNYISALQHGVREIRSRPLSTNLICEMHAILMRDVRGGDKRPGMLRDGQNWIGPERCRISEATFVPPPPMMLADTMSDFERYVNQDQGLPLLIKVGLSHSYFETIHPFFDGNGRLGRMIISLLLLVHGALSKPVLYLSYFLRRHRAEYNDRLQATREAGDLEGWLRLFLTGVTEVAKDATRISKAIINLREKHRREIVEQMNRGAASGLKTLENLFEFPLTTTGRLAAFLDISFPAATTIVQRFVAMGILVEITGRSRDRVYRYESYFRLFEPSIEQFET